jgi:hypothetical protein
MNDLEKSVWLVFMVDVSILYVSRCVRAAISVAFSSREMTQWCSTVASTFAIFVVIARC